MDQQPSISSSGQPSSVLLLSVHNFAHRSKLTSGEVPEWHASKYPVFLFCIGHPAGSRVSGPFNYLREHIYSQPHPSSGDLKVGVYCSSDSSYSYEFAPSNQRSCILKQVMRIESGILPKPGSRFTVCLCVICQLKERSTCSKSFYQFSRSHPMCCPYFK
jgi:hypothetical protein